MTSVVPERGASLRLVVWTPLAAAGLLAALITGRPELVVDVVGQAARHLRKPVVMPGPQPRDRCLEQVAEAVKLVA